MPESKAEALLPLRTPTTTGWGTWGSIEDLPDELLERARVRLRFLALLFSCFCVGGIAVELVLGVEETRLLYAVYVINGIASVALYLLCRNPRIRHARVLRLGLVYEFVLCLVVSVGSTQAQFLESGVLPVITWVSIMIVTFPLLIPSPPLHTLIAALAAAATPPVGLLILKLGGFVPAEWREFVVVSLTPAFCVVLAYAGSRVVYGLNVDVARRLALPVRS
jgi:hypothetical protein